MTADTETLMAVAHEWPIGMLVERFDAPHIAGPVTGYERTVVNEPGWVVRVDDQYAVHPTLLRRIPDRPTVNREQWGVIVDGEYIGISTERDHAEHKARSSTACALARITPIDITPDMTGQTLPVVTDEYGTPLHPTPENTP